MIRNGTEPLNRDRDAAGACRNLGKIADPPAVN
jgi:hypothetical protein